MSRRRLALSVVVAVYVALYFAFDRLAFPLRRDEIHFWGTTLLFSRQMPPSIEFLRSYEELNTPLPFLFWGWLEHTFGKGVWLARVANWVLSAAIVSMLVFVGWGALGRRRALAAIGLFVCPYYVFVSTHAYTDIPAIFFAVLGVHASLSGRHVWSALAFVLAIATRQLMVAFPVGLLVWRMVDRDPHRVLASAQWLSPLAAAASFLGWVAFFGDLGPAAVMRLNVSTDKTALRVPDALYFLSCVGVYFVLPREILYRTVAGVAAFKAFRSPVDFALAVVLLVLFLVFPPAANEFYAPSMGYFDRALQFFGLSRFVRIAVFFACAVLAVAGLRHQRLPFVLLCVNAALMLKAHQAWDKYSLPLIAVLWLLESRPDMRQNARVVGSSGLAPGEISRDTSEPATVVSPGSAFQH